MSGLLVRGALCYYLIGNKVQYSRLPGLARGVMADCDGPRRPMPGDVEVQP